MGGTSARASSGYPDFGARQSLFGSPIRAAATEHPKFPDTWEDRKQCRLGQRQHYMRTYPQMARQLLRWMVAADSRGPSGLLKEGRSDGPGSRRKKLDLGPCSGSREVLFLLRRIRGEVARA
jgi:hypothetical protein